MVPSAARVHRAEGEHLLDQVVGVAPPDQGRLDLAHDELQVFAAGAAAASPGGPGPTAGRSSRCPGASPAAPHPGAVPHLGQGGAQVGHVRGLVGPDVGHQRAASPSPATRSVSASTASAHWNPWKAEISISSRPIMRPTTISRVKSMSSGSTRAAMAASAQAVRAARASLGRVSMPMRASMAAVWSVGDRVLEGDVAGHEPHAVVAGLVPEAGLVAGVGLEQAAAQVGDGRAGDVLVEGRRRRREREAAAAWRRSPPPCRCG